jgi:hypothetical protein
MGFLGQLTPFSTPKPNSDVFTARFLITLSLRLDRDGFGITVLVFLFEKCAIKLGY